LIGFVLGMGMPADATILERLERWRSRSPALAARPVHEWVSADRTVWCYWVAHDPDHLGGIRYVHADEDSLALFAGRPLLWDGVEADGRTSLDPTTYLQPPEAWAERLDGRYAVARVVGGTLHLLTDPAGLQPVYEARRPEATWFTNVAPLIARATDPVRHRALAAVLATGQGVTGEPISAAVDRVPPGTLLTLAPGGARDATPTNAVTPDDFRHRADFDQAAGLLVTACRALGEWPGRPQVAALTGGYDSRMVGAAIRQAGLTVDAVTLAYEDLPGYPETEDVELGRTVSTRLGFKHHQLLIGDEAPIFTDLAGVAADLKLASPGTLSLHDALDSGLQLPGDPLPVLYDGVGGELGRGAFDHQFGTAANADGYRDAETIPAMVDGLLRRFVADNPRPLVNGDALALLRNWFTEFVTAAVTAGFALRDVPEVCFLHFIGAWQGTKTLLWEVRWDSQSPLLSRRLWPHLLGEPLADRLTGVFHREVTRRLGPDLADVPYSSRSAHYGGREQRIKDRPWRQHRQEVSRRAAEARRNGTWPDPVDQLHATVTALLGEQPQHPAWDVLDRTRITELISTEPARLDRLSRFQLWHLATVFLA
jgi:hypothetical protein